MIGLIIDTLEELCQGGVAVSIVMKVDDISGDVVDLTHLGWLDIDRLGWGGVRRRLASPTSTRGDRESSVAELLEIKLSRHMDSASPHLFLEACCGRGRSIILRLTKTGQGSVSDVFL